MKKALIIVLSLSSLLVSGVLLASQKKTAIAAAVVEHAGAAEVVRLMVNPNVESIDENIICAEGMIRVRLDGISNRGQETQELPVPKGGPFRRVRIVERNPSNSVVQLFPTHNPLATCGRTTVAAFGKEIVISTTYTESESARLNPKPVEETAAAVAPKTASVAREEQIAAPAGKVVSAGPSSKGGEKSDSKDNGLVFKKNDGSGDASQSPALGNSVLDTPKLAFGFGFAAVAAALALYLKKKKGFPGADLDNIEILSTKRLGVRQQLVLVSVQGVRFLLGVSDKNVTSLGVVSDEDAGVRRLPPHEPEAPKVSVESTLETLIGEASRRAVKNDLGMDKTEPRTQFDSELRRAMEQTPRREERPREERPNVQPRFDSASNAAGLVALARMRANLKKSTGRSQIFEA